MIEVAGLARLEGGGSGDEFTGITSLAQPNSTGSAGTIRIRADRIEILDGARIAARPEAAVLPGDAAATGDAGDIELEAATDLVLRDATVSTESPSPTGGNVAIAAGRVVELVDSTVTTSVLAGSEPGGDIRIAPGPVVTRLERSAIRADANRGDGGNIFLQTGLLLVDPASAITADSTFGRDGTTTVDSPEGEVNVQQPELPTPPVDARALLREPCAARDPRAASSLVVEPDPGPVLRDDEVPLAPVSDLLVDPGGWARGDLVVSPSHGRDRRCAD